MESPPTGSKDEHMAVRRADLARLKSYLEMFPQEWAIAERTVGSNKRTRMINVVLSGPAPAGRSPPQVSRNVSPEFARMLVLLRKLAPELIEMAERQMDGKDAT